MQPQPPQEARLMVQLPPELEVGVYASLVAVWHDADVFTLDFTTIIQPPQQAHDPETGQDFAAVSAKVVSRVRIPASQVFEVMKALEQQLSMWEKEKGHKAGAPGAGD